MKTSFDFYAYWNGPEVADLWNIIASMTATEDYKTLLMAVMLTGFLGVLLSSALKNRGIDVISWCATTLVILSLAFLPKISITVKDVRAGYAQTVDNIPIGIGWPASITSRVSWWLTETFETAFQDIEAARYSRFGVAFPQRAVTAVMGMGAVTEKGREAVRAVAEHCIIPEILDDPSKRRAILSSPDIYGLVTTPGWVNPARRTLLDGTLLTCSEAVPKLAEILETHELPAMEEVLLAKLETGGDDLAAAAVLQAVPGAEEIMLGLSRTLGESLKHSVMLAALPDAVLSSAARSGKAPLTTGVAIARAQGNLASEINYRALSDMAKSALPKVRNILEFIVIGLFPIVFILMAGLGLSGTAVIRSYMTLLISLGLWAPITAIINFLTIRVDADPLNRLVEASGGVTLSAATLIREAGASSQAMAGSLMWLVPILAYAVAKGSDMALTSMASSVLAPASSAAQAQGSSIAMGNVSAGNASVGNASLNNASGNKTDMSSGFIATDRHQSGSAYGTWQGSLSTGTVTGMSIVKNDLGVSSQSGIDYGVVANSTTSNLTDTGFTSATQHSYGTALTQGDSTTGSRISTTMSGQTSALSHSSSATQSNTFGENDSISIGTAIQSSGSSVDQLGLHSNLSNSTVYGTKNEPQANVSISGNSEPISNTVSAVDNNMLTFSSSPSCLTALPEQKNRPTASPSRMSGLLNADKVGINASAQSSSSINDSASRSLTNTSTTTISGLRANQQTFLKNQNDSLSGSEIASYNSSQISNLQSSKSTANRQDWSTHQSRNKSRSFGNSTGAKISTGVDMNTKSRDEAIAVFGSPQEALANLSTSLESRLAFGHHMQSISRETGGLTQNISNNIGNATVPGKAYSKNDLTISHDSDSVGIADAHNYSSNRIASNSVSSSFESTTYAQPVSNSDREAFYLNKGLQIAASASYETTSTGYISVASRSYLFGFGYQSPSQLYHDMFNESKADAGFKEALVNLGKEFSNNAENRTIDAKEIINRLEKH